MDNNTALQTVEEPATQTKRCSRCGEDKPLDAFSPRRMNKSRYASECKACHAIRYGKYSEKKKEEQEIKLCAKCGKIKALDQFYRDASRPDKHKCSCKECMNADMGWYPEGTTGDYVESQIISIIQAMAEAQCRLDEVQPEADTLQVNQKTLQAELSRICKLVYNGDDPLIRESEYGKIVYDHGELSVTLQPEVAGLHRDRW